MAITGTIMALFVMVHMVGNLKVLAGPQAFNGYAAWLRQVAYPLLPHEGLLWAMRLALGACVAAHVAATPAVVASTPAIVPPVVATTVTSPAVVATVAAATTALPQRVACRR